MPGFGDGAHGPSRTELSMYAMLTDFYFLPIVQMPFLTRYEPLKGMLLLLCIGFFSAGNAYTMRCQSVDKIGAHG